MSVRKNKNLARRIHIFLLAGAMAFVTAAPVYAIPTNTQLPSRGSFEYGGDKNGITFPTNNIMNIVQQDKNAVIKWQDFSIGADATVNFKGFDENKSQFNTLNYINSGNVSEIYGQINAQNGNIYIVNTAGVQIGGSAQINVGSLYVSNKKMTGNNLSDFYANGTGTPVFNGTTTNAELMSLGGIVTEGNVTFDGNRVVIDVDHLYKNTDGAAMDTGKQLTIKTTDANNVVLGYTAYDETKKTYANAKNKEFKILQNKDGNITENTVNGYMWVENLLQLQAMETKLDGNYALRNSIDANFSADSEYNYAKDQTAGNGFASIGSADKNFTGKFDGLGYDIFDLNVKDGQDYAGLFGYVDGAIIRNFTLNSGSVAGGANTGAAVGYANNSTISNIINTADVTGTSNVGGLVGYAQNSKLDGLINTGTVTGTNSNIGGIAGNIIGSSITGETYNLGAVKGSNNSNNTFNVGGIVGSADASTIGNKSENGEDVFVIYNELTVTGGYNVGGIAGQITDSDTADGKTMVVQNVANEGAVLAEGYDNDKYSYHSAFYKGIQSIDVKAANAGGIVGNANNASVSNAENSGDVTTTMTENSTTGNYYNAGNVGGIIGRAEDTDITTVVNKENNVAGAHNVGGVVGYLTGNSKVDGAINNGGDITATGARKAYTDTFAQESVRQNGSEVFNIGNIGGIVGYMYGDNTQVANSANRGTVHSAYIDNPGNVLEISKAANVGGVVGKLDMDNKSTIDEIKKDTSNASITGSYNTGSVQGYTGVGGVTGFMYNGSVAASYNLGNITTTRQVVNTGGSNIDPLNMGGIVGDTTEETNAQAVIYDVYNTGQIGDDNYKYFARHVGGIVGRLSGTVEKAYNTGDIYNYDTAVGGIAGWWYNGQIKDVFNTGNITIKTKTELQAGGIVGAAQGLQNTTLSNAYNLGTIRGFQEKNDYNDSGSYISLGGIIGRIYIEGNLSISNVYTMGNLYAARKQSDDNYISIDNGNNDAGNGIEAIVGRGTTKDTTNAFYIKPEADKGFADLGTTAGVTGIEYNQRHNADSYKGFGFSSQDGGDVEINTGEDWRIYDGTTPILNAFLPNAEDYFDQFNNSKSLKEQGINSIQYGTAFNPLLTIINAKEDASLKYNWSDLGISGAGGLAVYGNDSLTLNDFATSGANKYFGGTIYSDGALNLNGKGDNFNLGSGSKLYGSSVTLDAENGDMTVYGSVTSTDGDITINGDDIEIIGKLTAAAQGDQTTIAGISSEPVSMDATGLNDPDESMQSITDRFAYTTNAANNDGNITITASGTAEVLYGHLSTGKVTAGGNLSVTGKDSVYIDTDLHIGGNLNLTSSGEMLIDISNMGDISKENLHVGFLDHFKTTTSGGKGAEINISGSNDFKITVDLWDYENGTFDLNKYDVAAADYTGATDHKLTDDIKNLNVRVNDKTTNKSHTYIWIDSAEQLKGIQKYKEDNAGTGILGYNFALKNDIDASQITDYKAIASDKDEAFTGTFDGRDNRIIGLTVGKNDAQDTVSSAGIFGTIGTGGAVEDLRIYSSNFYGKDYAGAVAGINKGTVTGVITLGNHVEAFGSSNSENLITNGDDPNNTIKKYVGAAGGIAGLNSGKISDSFASDSVIAGHSGESGGLDAGILTTAGGIAGINDGTIEDVTADSAITANQSTTYSLGGITGFNRNGSINTAYNTGVTHGEYGDGNITSNSVGGIAGVNTGSISDVYNSADITGGNYVGGIVGYNHKVTNDLNGQITIPENSGQISNAVNAGDILADFIDKSTGKNYTYTGGLAGYNSGSISSGRNTGEIYGGDYVGGMVGANQVIKDDQENVIKGSGELSNLSNSVFATITGESYVGGIAGQNYGNINATESAINNYGKVYGQHFVGGIAGANEEKGIIKNTISSIELNVKDTGKTADYFGGVVGQNKGTINGATNESAVDVAADGATFVGGIIGHNTSDGKLEGIIYNAGLVTGKENVGGIIGQNDNKNVLQGTEDKRLTVINEGTVKAESGGAAGIFYTNNGLIKYADITNKGTVIGDNGATGGLFGINKGDITNSTLTNSGIVTGGGTVGGLIGENTGNISKSSLKNEVGATVIGIKNVGGLIGKNTGTIEGGRDDNNSYYKYQIYNNGVINVGTWNDGNNNGIVDADEIGALTNTVTSTNIGGLIGSNTSENDKTGSLTAGYNTGAINAAGSTNVGGIVGNNEGTVDQVFNTVMTADDSQAAAITGGTNVGGIIGSNSGHLSNAYNTTEVVGTDTVGNVVGLNDTNGTITNIYATNTSGSLIGSNRNTNNTQDAIKNAYSFVEGDKSATKVLNNTEQKQSNSYEGFDFDATDGAVIWKNYDSNGTPILKVFLTNASYSGDNSFVYNGQQQGVNVGNISAADSLSAYKNANELLQNLLNKDAGSYTLYSQQIAASDEGAFNPNNLGYDIDFSYKIDKATLSIILDAISRVYGNSAISNGTKNNYGYEFDIKLTDEMKKELDSLGFKVKGDGAVDNTDDGRTTNDAGKYTWSAEFTLNDDLAKNYQFGSDGATTLTLDDGLSTVEKASLIINVGNIETTYGTAFDESQYSHRFEGITNGDTEDVINGLLNGKYTNDAAKDGTDGKWTDNAGTYTDAVGIAHNDLKNYNVTVNKGDATVNKANLTINVGNAGTTYGTAFDESKYSHSLSGITNGDTEDIINGLLNGKYTNDAAKDGTDGKWTDNAGTYTDAVGIAHNDLKNYNVTVNKGDATVNKANLTINVGNAGTTYGTAFDESKYSHSLSGITNGDTEDIINGLLNGKYTNDAAKDGTDGKWTDNAGTYTDAVGIAHNDLKNYNVTVNKGDATVNKANLTINVGNAGTTYGTAFDESKYSHSLSGITNGDTEDIINGLLNGKYTNDAAKDGTDGKWTDNAGTYTDAVGIAHNDLKNYNVTVNKGNVTVNKATISIGADNVQINLGQTPNYTGTDINDVLVNGDKFTNDYHYGVEDSTIENTFGTHVNSIGIWIGNSFYELSDEGSHWSGSGMDAFFSNYDITFTPGTLTVGEKVEPDYNWDYLYNDNPFDRLKNFRERKAEINFVDGGMEI